MDTIEAIMTRRSVRNYLDKDIPDEIVEQILRAGQTGPVCVNARDWAFLVTKDPEVLNLMADGNGGPANTLRKAKLGIMILGDTSKAFKPAPDYWVIDGAIAGQNMVLAAHALGVGSVWLGTWPQMERVNAQIKNFNLPENMIPHSIIAFGYIDEEAAKKPYVPAAPPADMPADMLPPPPKKDAIVGGFEPELVHYDKW